MRLAASVLATVALLACGNYSDADIPFIEALPTSAQLHLAIPAASGQALCSTFTSDALANAQLTGGSINSGITSVLVLVDHLATLPPTTRETGERIWGPVTDGKHPGFEDMVTMQAADGGFSYDLEVAPKGDGGWLPIITGQFNGSTASSGSGSLVLHFDNAAKLTINDPTDPAQPLTVNYDLGSDPQTIDVNLQEAGLGLLGFDYHYQLASDGTGQFLFEAMEGGNTAVWTVNFQTDGSGTAAGTFTSGGASGSGYESWDAAACVDCLNDPINVTIDAGCTPTTPCIVGDGGTCGAG